MRNRLVLIGLVAVYLVLAGYYSLVNPPFEAPDEVWHYAYIREIAMGRGLPVLTPGGPAPWGQEGAQAPLYYLLGAPIIGWIDQSSLTLPNPNPFARIGEPRATTSDNRNAFLHVDEAFPFTGTTLALHLLRLYSVVLGGMTVALCFALARAVFPDLPIVALAGAAFVASLPQFLFIASSVNNDNLATLLSTAMLWQLARILRRGISPLPSMILGATAGAALLTKFNTVTVVPLALLVIFLLTAPKHAWRRMVLHMGLIVLLVALIAGWWYARNILLYGDLSGLSLIIQMIGNRSAPIGIMRWFLAENEGMRLSIWGVFGWMNVLAAPPYYSLFDMLALVGILGMLTAVVRRRGRSLGAAILALWCAVVFAELVYYNLQLPASQGRLLFPALAAWAVLWARGIAGLIPRQVQTVTMTALAAGQMLVAGLTPAIFIAPAYAPVQLAAVPPNTLPIGAQLDNGAELIGAKVNQTTIHPGDSLDVMIFTSVAKSEIAHTALFVHVINGDNVIVAQRDSAIASGNWSRLGYPTIVADSLRVYIPITAPAPDQWRVEVGAYDLETRVRWSKVGTARDSFTIANLPVQPTATSWGYDFDGLTILDGADTSPHAGVPGGTLHVTLHWQAAPPGYRVFVHALGESDHIWASADEPVAREMDLPIRFAADTPPGVYPLEIGLYPIGGDRVPVFDRHGQLIGDRLFLGSTRINP